MCSRFAILFLFFSRININFILLIDSNNKSKSASVEKLIFFFLLNIWLVNRYNTNREKKHVGYLLMFLKGFDRATCFVPRRLYCARVYFIFKIKIIETFYVNFKIDLFSLLISSAIYKNSRRSLNASCLKI